MTSTVLDSHVPDISTEQGLLDVIAVGNILELHKFMDRRYYNQHDSLSPSDLEEMTVARWYYRRLQKWFSATYFTSVGDEIVCSISIFQHSLVEFSAAVVNYKSECTHNMPMVTGCSTGKVLMKVFSDFSTSEYPELLECFKFLVDKQEALHWTGDPIKIQRKVVKSEPAWTDFVTRINCAGATDHPVSAATGGKRGNNDILLAHSDNINYVLQRVQLTRKGASFKIDLESLPSL